MKDELKVLIMIFFGLCVSQAYLFVPENTREVSFFIFDDQKLTPQTHAWFIFNRLNWCIIFFSVYMTSTQFKKDFLIIFVMQCLGLVDYLLTYSNPWIFIGPIPVSWTTCYLAVFAILIIQRLLKWNS